MSNSGLSSNKKAGDRLRVRGNGKGWLLSVILLLGAVFFVPPGAAHSQTAPVLPQPIIKIEIQGLYSISKEELLYLLGIHAGKPLNKVEVSEGIKRAFLKGIFDDISVESLNKNDTDIRITVKEKKIISRVEIKGNEHFSDRFIKKHLGINKGERLSILKIRSGIKDLKSDLGMRGFVNANVAYTITPEEKNRAGIVVEVHEGKPEIIKDIVISGPDDIVKSDLKLSRNDIFDRTKMEALTKRVTQHYKKEGYVGTTLSYSYRDGALEIKMDPGKKLDITFKGNTALTTKALMKEAPFFEVNEFSEDLLEETTARIVSLYHKNGYPFAQVAPIKSSADRNVHIEFFIFEGERYSVDSIRFEGTTIPQEKLRNILAMRAGDYYNPDLLETDMDNIAEFYHALGYLYMRIQEPEIKMPDKKVDLTFIIDEGPQVNLSSISVKGNTYFPENEIMKHIPLKPGQPYNEVDVSEARRKILEFYNNNGFLDAGINVEREISGTSASIVFVVQEGDITLFGKSIIIGNEHTKQEIIKREFVHKQDNPFDYSMLLKERQRLYRSGLFADIEVSPLEKEDHKKDILYRFKEAKAGAVEFGLGYGEYEQYRGFADISYRNLFGMNKQASFRTELSSLERRFILSYHEPQFLGRDLIFRTLLLHENRKEVNIDTRGIRYRLIRNTVTSGFEKRLSDTLKSEIYYDFSVVKTSDVKPDVVLSREDVGTLIISSIRPGLIYDTRDNPFEPRKGMLAGLSFKLASSILFSETDFLKAVFYVNKYQALSKRLVLAVSLRGGAANGFGSTRELPLVERFFLGGRTTVRGYAQDTLGPKGADGTPLGGNAFAMGNLELRTDIGKGIGIVTFLDGGNVWRKSAQVDIAAIKYAAGLGLRYNTPVGPFRVDYGYKLNRERGESSGEIHFSLGHAF